MRNKMENQKKKELIRSCCEGISYIFDIRKILPDDDKLVEISNIFKALGDPTRVKILYALLKYEICVGEIANLLEIPQSHVSHQLRILKKFDIVDFEKDKKMSFYYIKDEKIRELLNLILKEK
ncbi:ArsR/SmtB family transcription factor [Malaciobacter mytili]|uniref:ArsR/SmtB family transcription factor n=1 Tax=Malaciobacter mytili TaxID=603050 RepID=UPI00100C251E|nr:metalloregulator ArsR/SmtB family transcription factor [Malaciobacter mytili]